MVVGSAPIQYSPIPIEEDQSRYPHCYLCSLKCSVHCTNGQELARSCGTCWQESLYNVQTADPCARHAQLTTKFRLIGNEAAYVELFFALEVGQLLQILDEANSLYFRPWESRRQALMHY